MELVKIGRKWMIEGDDEGWIFNKRFPMKWKAQLAMKVFKKGGRVSDYWKEARKHPKRNMNACKVKKKLQKVLNEIEALNPTSEEIKEYAEDAIAENADYGLVSITRAEHYFRPRLHDTWGQKQGGRVHIDIGSSCYHLMLNKHSAPGFVEFIKNKRKNQN